MRWFGEPWPRRDFRAPICADDEYEVETPVGEECLGCGDPIVAGERGVLMAAGVGIPRRFSIELTDGEGAWWRESVVAQHIDCHVLETAGPEIAALALEQIPRRPA